MGRAAAITALSLVFAAGLTDSAAAMTTTVSRTGLDLTVEVTGEASELTPKNAIQVTEDASNTYVEDSSIETDAVVPGGTCFQVSNTKIGCPADTQNRTRLLVTPGDGDDAVSVDLPVRSLSGIASVFVHGGPGRDALTGSEGPDTIEGEGLNGVGQPLTGAPVISISGDTLFGRGGADTLRGGPGIDYLNGASGATVADGANMLDGGSENDYFDVGTALGPDRVIGGPSARSNNASVTIGGTTISTAVGDTVSYDRRTFATAGTAGVTVDLDASADDGATGAGEGDQIDTDVEGLTGSPRDDRLVGTSSVQRLEGGLGSDSLSGAGGADDLRFREGVRDKCYALTSGATVDLDLADPTPEDCSISLIPITTKLTRSPRDETMPPPTIGSVVRRPRADRLTGTVSCDRAAPRDCVGALAAQSARGGAQLARTKFRIKAGAKRKIVLRGSERRLRGLRSARLTTVTTGLSRRGKTTVLATRRVR